MKTNNNSVQSWYTFNIINMLVLCNCYVHQSNKKKKLKQTFKVKRGNEFTYRSLIFYLCLNFFFLVQLFNEQKFYKFFESFLINMEKNKNSFLMISVLLKAATIFLWWFYASLTLIHWKPPFTHSPSIYYLNFFNDLKKLFHSNNVSYLYLIFFIL